MKYRSEIDGLRAVAVLPVIFFHAGFETFSGGYVGVDVFFVISGYLITSIIMADLEHGRFSLVHFYERRARRILPALYLVMACTLPFAWWWMQATALEDYAQSLGAVAIFSSNILFWLESDYFAAAAETKPLLHTWSLAVEEQFYVLFPLFLLLMFGLGRARLAMLIGLSAALSLALSEWWRPMDAMANFYLAPTRAWELALGALVALRGGQAAPGWHPLLAAVAALLGLTLITASVFVFDRTTLFPGIAALVPTVGTLLVIIAANPHNLAGRLLSARWLVAVGLVSYSAYLWHQPLFAFARIRADHEPPDSLLLALAVLALVLAWGSWRYVERPFRDRRRTDSRAVWRMALGGFLLFGGLSLAAMLVDLEALWMKRLGPLERDRMLVLNQAVRREHNLLIDSGCRIGSNTLDAAFRARFDTCRARHGKAVFVLGDSQGQDLYNAIAVSTKHPFVAGLATGYCRPHRAVSQATPRTCEYAEIADFIQQQRGHVAAVLFTQTADAWFHDWLKQPDMGDLSETAVVEMLDYLGALRANTHLPVVMIGPMQHLDREPGSLDPTQALEPQLAQYAWRNGALWPALERYLEQGAIRREVIYVPRASEIGMQLPEDLMIDGQLTFSDARHWSRAGETFFGPRLVRHLATLDLEGFQVSEGD